MTALFAVAIAVGSVGILTLVVVSAISPPSPGEGGADTDRRRGVVARAILGGSFGFGMAGIAAAYAGWSAVASVAAAIVAGVLMATIAVILGPRTVR
jgi:hypothetical protein